MGKPSLWMFGIGNGIPKGFEKTKQDSADIFAFSMRVHLSEVETLLGLSGFQGHLL